MEKLRFGKYEIHRIDRLNVGVFRVLGDGDEERKGRIIKRVSDDGRRLEHTGTYYGSYGAAARALWELLLSAHIEDPEVASVADAIERAREDFRPVSEEIDRIGREGEAS